MATDKKSMPVINDQSDLAGIIARRLQKIYKSEFHEILVNRILEITTRHQYPPLPAWDEKDAILITYGNSIKINDEIPLKTLHEFLTANLSEVISTVHILPFFPYTSDDGFAVSDFMEVNPALGSWENIKDITGNFYLMTDLVINHVSSAHQWFKNYLQEKSPGKKYFIEAEKGSDYSMVVRPRTTALFTKFRTVSGEREVWTTFSSDQVDLNFSNPEVLIEIIRVLVFYISRGARFIRLDAIAFLWKCTGTWCLHLEETHEIVKLLRNIANFVRPGTVILTETNVPNRENWSYFGNDDEAHMVYQFSLPPLLLHALFSGDADYLTNWAMEIPDISPDQTFLNYTASHDGIGVRPLEGLLPADQLESLISGMESAGGLISMRSGKDGRLSPYEINITWFDAMRLTATGSDTFHESRFLCSQAIMIAMKGIPAFYIHSMLATPNNYKGVEITGRERTINRKQLDKEETDQILNADTPQSRIFTELKRLLGIRRRIPAFHPSSEQQIMNLGNHFFAFTRKDRISGTVVQCISNITTSQKTISGFQPKSTKVYDLISEEKIYASGQIVLKPYQTVWIKED